MYLLIMIVFFQIKQESIYGYNTKLIMKIGKIMAKSNAENPPSIYK